MFKIVTIPFNRNIEGFDEDLLNHFSVDKHIRGYRAEFFVDGEEKYWTVFVEYEPVLEEKTSRQKKRSQDLGLDETQKVLFERLRKWRRERSKKDGLSVYILGTNSELAEIVKSAPRSLEALSNVKGFGKSKVKSYGKDIISIVKAFYADKGPETQPEPEKEPATENHPKPDEEPTTENHPKPDKKSETKE
ncbi:HRDC domain-containing protein [Desulfobacterales bacterium HSG2]|nr:HRDC domain-containing protein [Desulfobacterales bacterium HSG2]